MTTAPGTIKEGQFHPAARSAANWVLSLGTNKLFLILESFQSCAIENNELARVCGETLRRLIYREPVSDRYVLGLAWTLREMEDAANDG